jgi:hypothetical protein
MKYYLYASEIDSENATDLIDFINDNEGPLVIGIYSSGGDASMSYFLSRILNANKDRITLIAIANIFSAAFEMWYRFEGQKEVEDETIGMVHLGGLNQRSVSGDGKLDDLGKAYIPVMKERKRINDVWVKPILSPAEFKAYNQNKDIYISTQRLREIAKSQNLVLNK